LAFGSIAVAGSKPQAIGNLLPANYTRSFLMLAKPVQLSPCRPN
jgi:hypothetical protein